jgi:hypothetical protein
MCGYYLEAVADGFINIKWNVAGLHKLNAVDLLFERAWFQPLHPDLLSKFAFKFNLCEPLQRGGSGTDALDRHPKVCPPHPLQRLRGVANGRNHKVGLHESYAVDPSLESAWFQPLTLLWFQAFA